MSGHLYRLLRASFNAVAAQMPVIGPHAGIEPALLLSGHKPIGWVPVFTDPDIIPNLIGEPRREYEVQQQLDAAVAAGQLKSCDVEIRDKSSDRTFVSRHYCQPQFEEEMQLLARVNQRLFNREQPDEALKKNFGEYLGYRKRDQMLWRILPDLPKPVADAIYKLNATMTQPAYQQHMLNKAGAPDFKPFK